MIHTRSHRRGLRRGVSLADVLVVLGVIGILCSLLLPAVQRMRERSRRVACLQNLRQFGVAAHSHEMTHRAFPYTARNYGSGGNRYPAVSPHQALMGFLEPTIAGKIDPEDNTVDFIHTTGPTRSLSSINRELQKITIPVLLCPSDRAVAGGTSYRANYGISPGVFKFDGTSFREPTARTGAFVNGTAVRADEFTDGLSATALFSERVLGDGDPSTYDPWRDWFVAPRPFYTAAEALTVCESTASNNPPRHDSFHGHNWLFGGPRHSWYDHISTPNSRIPDCMSGPAMAVGGGHSLMTSRSVHSGGVNVCFADGATKFIGDRIELKVWRAIGTRSGRDVIDAELE